jgi:hypothetical protein
MAGGGSINNTSVDVFAGKTSKNVVFGVDANKSTFFVVSVSAKGQFMGCPIVFTFETPINALVIHNPVAGTNLFSSLFLIKTPGFTDTVFSGHLPLIGIRVYDIDKLKPDIVALKTIFHTKNF